MNYVIYIMQNFNGTMNALCDVSRNALPERRPAEGVRRDKQFIGADLAQVLGTVSFGPGGKGLWLPNWGGAPVVSRQKVNTVWSGSQRVL